MKPSETTAFQTRAFVALVAAFSGLGLPATGLAIHLLQLEPITVARHAWMAAHTVLGILFAVFVLWHVLLNRHALLRHLRRAAVHVSREAVCAALFAAIALALAVGHAFHAG